MRGWKGTCDKCVGPPTCECFVSSTDVQEGAGPSSASARPTPSSPEHHDPDPLGSQETLVEGSAQTSNEEVVEDDVVPMGEEVCLYLEESSLLAGPSRTFSPISSSPSGSIAILTSPSSATPYTRPQASPGPRKTRGVPDFLPEHLAREQDSQTRHMGEVAVEMRCVADSHGQHK